MLCQTYMFTHASPLESNFNYLMDPNGRSITPITLTTGRPDPLPLHAGRGPTRAYHKAHGNITPAQKAQAERESLRYHARRAAEARAGGEVVNQTGEWRSSRENTPTESEDERESESGDGSDSDRMEE